jgi:gamma-glutamylcyclotransferase (GGCT)/AIG2-like uncharacterized protein YtfP
MIYYFAYGSNMDAKRMTERVVDFEIIGQGILEDFELKFNKINQKKKGVGYANVSTEHGKKVEGIIYRFENISLLDKPEGYPKHYDRKIMEIVYNSGRLKAWVYIANENRISEGLLPERDYLAHLLAGKDYLSKAYIDELYKQKVIEDKI